MLQAACTTYNAGLHRLKSEREKTHSERVFQDLYGELGASDGAQSNLHLLT